MLKECYKIDLFGVYIMYYYFWIESMKLGGISTEVILCYIYWKTLLIIFSIIIIVLKSSDSKQQKQKAAHIFTDIIWTNNVFQWSINFWVFIRQNRVKKERLIKLVVLFLLNQW